MSLDLKCFYFFKRSPCVLGQSINILNRAALLWRILQVYQIFNINSRTFYVNSFRSIVKSLNLRNFMNARPGPSSPSYLPNPWPYLFQVLLIQNSSNSFFFHLPLNHQTNAQCFLRKSLLLRHIVTPLALLSGHRSSKSDQLAGAVGPISSPPPGLSLLT